MKQMPKASKNILKYWTNIRKSLFALDFFLFFPPDLNKLKTFTVNLFNRVVIPNCLNRLQIRPLVSYWSKCFFRNTLQTEEKN